MINLAAEGHLSSEAERLAFVQEIEDSGTDGSVGFVPSVVGCTTKTKALSDLDPSEKSLEESDFLEWPSDFFQLFSVGEQINIIGDGDFKGTSFATAQVTGLAAYLWAFSFELQGDASKTFFSIFENTRSNGKST